MGEAHRERRVFLGASGTVKPGLLPGNFGVSGDVVTTMSVSKRTVTFAVAVSRGELWSGGDSRLAFPNNQMN